MTSDRIERTVELLRKAKAEMPRWDAAWWCQAVTAIDRALALLTEEPEERCGFNGCEKPTDKAWHNDAEWNTHRGICGESCVTAFCHFWNEGQPRPPEPSEPCEHVAGAWKRCLRHDAVIYRGDDCPGCAADAQIEFRQNDAKVLASERKHLATIQSRIAALKRQVRSLGAEPSVDFPPGPVTPSGRASRLLLSG